MPLPGAVKQSARAKINLALHVLGRRSDGYHELDTLAVFADLADKVEVAPAGELSLQVAGPFAAHAPGDRSDLAWRAAEAFFSRTGLNSAAAIRIEKQIPAGAGLGGGSADSAAVLRGLNQLFGDPIPPAELAETGLLLGADVPMCLAGQALRARGIGEQLEAIRSWPPLPIVLVWPGRPVSTAAAFAALACADNPPIGEPRAAGSPAELAHWLRSCRNDLEAPAAQLVPEIGELLRTISGTSGCLLARMSGSGSSCFGLYGSTAEAEAAALALGPTRPGWWVTATVAR